MHSSRLRALLAVIGTLAAALLAAPAASALGLAKLYAGPITAQSNCNPDGAGAVPVTQAGAVTDFCFAFRLTRETTAGDHLAATTIDSPPGVLANADSVTQCPVATFGVGTTAPANCDSDTQVGTALTEIRVNVAGIEIPVAVTGRVFDLEHTSDVAGLLGIQLDASFLGISLPKSKLLVEFTLRPGSGGALRSRSKGFPRSFDAGSLGTLPLAVDTFSFRFWGSRDDHPTLPNSFVRLGSSCGPATTRLTSESYGGEVTFRDSVYESTGCERLSIAHRTTVEVDDPRADVPTGITVTVDKAQAEDPDVLEVANVSRARVALPGLNLGAQVASDEDGLALCSAEAFSATTNVVPSCPAASRIGSVRMESPNAKVPFTGSVFTGDQPAGDQLPQLFIVADQGGTAPDAPRIKLVGQLSIDAQGGLIADLRDLPDFPFSRLVMTFDGGPHAATITPRACGTSRGTSELVPPSPQTAPATSSVELVIDQGCEPVAFAPNLSVAFRDTQAGADGAPTFLVDRADRAGRINRAVMHLPPGLLASLKGVPECDLAAGAGCSPASRLGTVTVTSGVGPAPFETPSGGIYLTSRPAGAVAGVAVIAPVRLGAIDLGTMVVPGRIDLRQSDNGLDLAIDVPLTHLGLPLNVRTMRIALDREQFSRNPTSCAPLALTGELTSDTAVVASVSAPVQATGCDRLGFAPQTAVTVSPGLKVGASPGLEVTVGTPSGLQSALRRVVVTLPAGFAADLSKLKRACTAAEFAQGSCPDSAVTGTIDGTLGILDEPITGRLILIRVPGQALPSIGLEFSGRFTARVLGRSSVAKSGQVMIDLDALPDAPVERLTIRLEAGDRSALKVSDLYCKDPALSAFSFVLTGQSGATVARSVPLPCAGTALAATAVHTGKLTAAFTGARGSTRPGLTISTTPIAGARLASLRVTLPRELRISRGKRTISATGGTVLAARSRTIRVAFTGGRERTSRVTVRQGTVERSRAGAQRKVTLKVTLRYTDGAVEHRRVRVR